MVPPAPVTSTRRALDQPRHALAVERHLRAVQQLLDGDGAQADLRRVPAAASAWPSMVGCGARRIGTP
jgi:hypothetical protein